MATIGRRSAFLYPEGEMGLLKAQNSLHRHMDLLSPLEIEFIAASERALRMRQRRRRLVTASFVALTMLMSAIAIFAERQSTAMLKQRMLAERAQAEAQSEAQRATLANLGAASAISPDGTRMLRIDPGGDVRVIDLASGRDISVIVPSAGALSAAIFSPDARFIATGTVSGVVSIADNALRPRAILKGHEAAVRRLAFSPDGRLLASGSDDTTARIWYVEEEKLLAVIKADSPVVGVGFSPDGRRVAVSSQNGSLYISDSRTGRTIR